MYTITGPAIQGLREIQQVFTGGNLRVQVFGISSGSYSLCYQLLNKDLDEDFEADKTRKISFHPTPVCFHVTSGPSANQDDSVRVSCLKNETLTEKFHIDIYWAFGSLRLKNRGQEFIVVLGHDMAFPLLLRSGRHMKIDVGDCLRIGPHVQLTITNMGIPSQQWYETRAFRVVGIAAMHVWLLSLLIWFESLESALFAVVWAYAVLRLCSWRP